MTPHLCTLLFAQTASFLPALTTYCSSPLRSPQLNCQLSYLAISILPNWMLWDPRSLCVYKVYAVMPAGVIYTSWCLCLYTVSFFHRLLSEWRNEWVDEWMNEWREASSEYKGRNGVLTDLCTRKAAGVGMWAVSYCRKTGNRKPSLTPFVFRQNSPLRSCRVLSTAWRLR